MGVLFNRGRHSFLSEERSLATVEVMAVSVSLLPVARIKDPDEGSLRKGYWDHSLKVRFNRGGKSWWAERDLPVYVTSAIRKPREMNADAQLTLWIPSPRAAHIQAGSVSPPINLNLCAHAQRRVS